MYSHWVLQSVEVPPVWVIHLLGRFHPTTVHFPIAFLLGAAALDVLEILRKRPTFPEARFVCVTLGAAGSLVAAPLGWADAASLRIDPGDAVVLAVHRWTGTFVAALSTLSWVLHAGLRKGRFLKFRQAARAAVIASALLVAVGSHFGGILVYGRDYFASALEGGRPPAGPQAPPDPRAPGKASPFERDILPLLLRRCVRCHGPGKQNGRLRLDSRDAVLRGGKSGPAALPRDSARSLLYRAITDPDPSTRMPQEAPPLPAEEKNRLRAWIDEGAP